MKNIFKTVLVLTVAMVAFTSCKKKGCVDPTATNYNEEAKKDDGSCEYADPEPVFSISDPTGNATFALNDTVHINAMVTYEEEMHGWEARIINTSANDTPFVTMAHDHLSTYHIHDYWVNNVSAHSDMMLQIKVFKEHMNGAEVVETVHFHCHPM